MYAVEWWYCWVQYVLIFCLLKKSILGRERCWSIKLIVDSPHLSMQFYHFLPHVVKWSVRCVLIKDCYVLWKKCPLFIFLHLSLFLINFPCFEVYFLKLVQLVLLSFRLIWYIFLSLCLFLIYMHFIFKVVFL